MIGSPDLMATALKMFVALALVLGGLAAILLLFKRMSKRMPVSDKNRLIKVVASSYIGFKKNVALVEVPGAVLVLGITGDAITMLTRLDREDLDKEMEMQEAKTDPGAFSEQLRQLMSGMGLGRR